MMPNLMVTFDILMPNYKRWHDCFSTFLLPKSVRFTVPVDKLPTVRRVSNFKFTNSFRSANFNLHIHKMEEIR